MAPIVTVADLDSLADAAAARLTTLVGEAAPPHKPVTVCLTGGSTAAPIYERWSDVDRPWRARVEWERLHFFWSDERHVPPDHPDSNFGLAARTLFDRAPVDPSHIHRMRGELPDAAEAARHYEEELRRAAALVGSRPHLFDVSLLSVGEDGHIASIFPDSPLLEAAAPVAAVWAPHLQTPRLTLTPSALLDAAAIVTVAAGRHKAAAVRMALEGPLDIRRCPAQLLRQAADRVEWIVDGEAAGAGRT